MKRSSILIFTIAFFLFSCEEESKEAFDQSKEAEKTSHHQKSDANGTEKTDGDPPTIVFGTKSKPCGKNDGCYCDGDKGLCLLINPEIAGSNPDLEEGEGYGDIFIQDDQVVLGIRDDHDPSNKGERFRVRRDFELSKTISEKLGHQEVIIQKGIYPVDYSHEEYPFGLVTLEAEME
ncbi:MAG: hypothetical protein ABEH38_07255 [Flavobacteriales bacterium]